jgi:hypothetical protein
MNNLLLDGYQDVDSCTKGIEGENLLHNNGFKTHSLEPKVYFVPWIIYDGVRLQITVFWFDKYFIHYVLFICRNGINWLWSPAWAIWKGSLESKWMSKMQ